MPGKNLVNNYSSDAENVWEVLFSHFLLDLDKASNDLQSIVYNLHRTSLKIIFQLMHTMFKNHQKCLIWIFEFSPYFCLIKSDLSGNTIYSKCRIWILALSTNFCLKKLTCLVTLFDCKVQIFKLTIFWYFWLIFVHSKWKVSGLQKLAKIDSFWHFQQTLDN